MDIVKIGKVAASVVSVCAVIFGAIYFVEDRYQNVADAKTMMAKLEKASVDTFQQQQEYTDTQQKRVELEILDILKSRYQDTERRLEKNPASVYLNNLLERLKSKIRRMEDRLYQ